jgi:uncharacterized protein YoxC
MLGNKNRGEVSVDNITLVAVGIIALWLVAIAFYLIISRQQGELIKDIDELEKTMEKSEEEQE